MECPEAMCRECDVFFKEMFFYIQQGDYITHYIDYTKITEYTTPLLIKYISINEKKVAFFSWDNHLIKEYEMSFQEYFHNFVSGVVIGHVINLDIFHPVVIKNTAELRKMKFEKTIFNGKLDSISQLSIVAKMKAENIRKSIIVFEEWYAFLQFNVPQIIQSAVKKTDVFVKTDDYSKKRLLEMVHIYNKAIDAIEKEFVGR